MGGSFLHESLSAFLICLRVTNHEIKIKVKWTSLPDFCVRLVENSTSLTLLEIMLILHGHDLTSRFSWAYERFGGFLCEIGVLDFEVTEYSLETECFQLSTAELWGESCASRKTLLKQITVVDLNCLSGLEYITRYHHSSFE